MLVTTPVTAIAAFMVTVRKAVSVCVLMTVYTVLAHQARLSDIMSTTQRRNEWLMGFGFA